MPCHRTRPVPSECEKKTQANAARSRMLHGVALLDETSLWPGFLLDKGYLAHKCCAATSPQTQLHGLVLRRTLLPCLLFCPRSSAPLRGLGSHSCGTTNWSLVTLVAHLASRLKNCPSGRQRLWPLFVSCNPKRPDKISPTIVPIWDYFYLLTVHHWARCSEGTKLNTVGLVCSGTTAEWKRLY